MTALAILWHCIKKKETKIQEEKDEEEKVKSKRTSVCHGKTEGLSCSKIVLVDVFTEDNPEIVTSKVMHP